MLDAVHWGLKRATFNYFLIAEKCFRGFPKISIVDLHAFVAQSPTGRYPFYD
jgi:hypothetical protein